MPYHHYYTLNIIAANTPQTKGKAETIDKIN